MRDGSVAGYQEVEFRKEIGGVGHVSLPRGRIHHRPVRRGRLIGHPHGHELDIPYPAEAVESLEGKGAPPVVPMGRIPLPAKPYAQRPCGAEAFPPCAAAGNLRRRVRSGGGNGFRCRTEQSWQARQSAIPVVIQHVLIRDNDIRHDIQRLQKAHGSSLNRKDRSETPSRSELGIAAELDCIPELLLGKTEGRLAGGGLTSQSPMAGRAGRLRARHIEAGLRIRPSLCRPPGEQPCDRPNPGRMGKAGASRQGTVGPLLRNRERPARISKMALLFRLSDCAG